MELLDRYLKAVKFWLPRERQEDLLAELAEDLRSQIEDEQARLGRPLAEAELEALLKERGHPMWVAEPYFPQRYLIGPLALPAYWRALKITISSIWVFFVGLYLVLGLTRPGAAPDLLSWLWQGGLYTFAYIGLLTMIFALGERSQRGARSAESWDPRRPQALPAKPVDAEARRRQALRSGSFGELAGSIVFILWWVDVLRLPSLPELQVTLAPVWQRLYWPILAVEVGWAALAAVTLFRAQRTPLLAGLGLARDGCGLAVLALLLAAGEWVEVSLPGAATDAGWAAEAARTLSHWANVSVAITLGFVGLSLAAKALQDGRGISGRRPLRHWALSLLGAD